MATAERRSRRSGGGSTVSYTLCCKENAQSGSYDPVRCATDVDSCAADTGVCASSPEIKWVQVNGAENYGGTTDDSQLRCREGNEDAG